VLVEVILDASMEVRSWLWALDVAVVVALVVALDVALDVAVVVALVVALLVTVLFLLGSWRLECRDLLR